MKIQVVQYPNHIFCFVYLENEIIKQKYIGYTIQEAKKLFKKYIQKHEKN